MKLPSRVIMLAVPVLLVFTAAGYAASNPSNVAAVKDIATIASYPAALMAQLGTVQLPSNFQGGRLTNGRSFTWESASLATGLVPDGINIIKPSDHGSNNCSVGCMVAAWTGLVDGYWGGVINSPGIITQTDSTSAWRAAITAANVNPSLNVVGTFTIPQLNFGVGCPLASQTWVSDQLYLPFGVDLEGTGQGAIGCQINVINPPSAAILASGVVRIGDGTFVDADTEANHLTVNMNAQDGIAFNCTACQDRSGFNYDFAYQVKDGPGFWIDGLTGSVNPNSSNTYEFRHNTLWGWSGRTAGGDGMLLTGVTYPADVNTNDVLSFTGHTFENFVHIKQNLVSSSQNWTLEDNGGPGTDGATGILYEDDPVIWMAGMTTNNIDKSIVLTRPANSGFSATLEGIFRISGTHTIVNQSGFCGPAITIDDSQVPFFSCGVNGWLDWTNTNIEGNIFHPGIASDAGKTDATVCEDTTTHEYYSGSGTLGVCLGTSGLFAKRDVRPLPFGSSLLRILISQPVSYWYKKGHGDNGNRVQYGFVADWMGASFPELVGRDANGHPNSFDMFGMFAWLVRAFQGLCAVIGLLTIWNICLTILLTMKRPRHD